MNGAGAVRYCRLAFSHNLTVDADNGRVKELRAGDGPAIIALVSKFRRTCE